MSGAWITDLGHFLDADGWVGPKSGPARSLAIFLAGIAAWVSRAPTGEPDRTNVSCRRRPGRVPCEGEILASLDQDSRTIDWACPMCGDHGTINGWEGTRWDCRADLGSRPSLHED